MGPKDQLFSLAVSEELFVFPAKPLIGEQGFLLVSHEGLFDEQAQDFADCLSVTRIVHLLHGMPKAIERFAEAEKPLKIEQRRLVAKGAEEKLAQASVLNERRELLRKDSKGADNLQIVFIADFACQLEDFAEARVVLVAEEEVQA